MAQRRSEAPLPARFWFIGYQRSSFERSCVLLSVGGVHVKTARGAGVTPLVVVVGGGAIWIWLAVLSGMCRLLAQVARGEMVGGSAGEHGGEASRERSPSVYCLTYGVWGKPLC